MKDYRDYEKLEGWRNISIGSWFDEICEKFCDRKALTFRGETLTYSALHESVDNMASAFQKKGIQKGEKAVLQLPNSISFVVCFFALIKIGAIPVLALPAHRENEINGIIKATKAAVYIVADKYMGFDYLEMAEKIRQENDCLKFVAVDGKPCSGCVALNDFKDKNYYDNVESDAYKTALMLLSGGTTGIPKLIPRTHADYLYNVYCAAKRCRIDENDIYLAVLPTAHTFPFACPGLLGTLYCGGEVVFCEFPSPDEILDNISEYKITFTALVPQLVSICMDIIEWDNSFDMSSLKKLLVGGAVLETSLAERVAKNLPNRLTQVYGMAEGLICITDYDEKDEVLFNCQGKPISEADEILIVDDMNNPVEKGKSGELITKGPYTIENYYDMESDSFDDRGFYHTGDMAYITPEGNVKILGRVKELINRAGEKITPSEVEKYLCMCDGVKQAAVFGIPDELLGNKICAVISYDNDVEMSYTQMREFLKDKGLAEFKLPDEIKYISEFPLTAVGKIDKKKLREMILNKEV